MEERNVGMFAEKLPQEPISKTPSTCQGVLAGAADMSARKMSGCNSPLKGNGIYTGTRGIFPEQSAFMEK